MTTSVSHSAQVSLELVTESCRIPLAQLARDFAIPRKPVTIAPCRGEILMTVDGLETRMPVFLPDGIEESLMRFRISSLEKNGTS